MNNLTKTETLPKSGHVNEVCKEWLVREDGALAYKLQSQEINDFYKGNRFRNAVVREDFPTALLEQIKEKENADKHAEAYRRRLQKQEEHDKRVAKEIAEKLERDIQEQQQSELQESELMAQQMQEIYVNLPAVPPPVARDKNKPPPRPAKKLSPEKYDQIVGNDVVGFNAIPTATTTTTTATAAAAAAERHMQEHADDIELYVDPCDYASLKEIGLPMEEIKEISRKLKQEQKDEMLARRLQEMEATDGLTQEERDRMLAIEAQDKELAKMLQEREKAKVKRAKEKARLRKNQQKESATTNGTASGLHCGPVLPLPQNCMSSLKQQQQLSTCSQAQGEELIDLEAYSNPIDVIQNQRTQNGTLTNGSLTRDNKNKAIINSNNRHNINHNQRDDDIYTLPVDSCRPGQRPSSLNISPDVSGGHHIQSNSMTRSENYALEGHGHEITPTRMNYSKSGTFDHSSSPTPPYMPIQGTRRSNSSEDRKKKSKDKCTHQ